MLKNVKNRSNVSEYTRGPSAHTRNTFFFCIRFGRASTEPRAVIGKPWVANCRRTLHRTMLDPNRWFAETITTWRGQELVCRGVGHRARSARLSKLGRTLSAMRSRAVSYGSGPRWSHQHFGPNNGTRAATRDDEKTPASCSLNTSVMGL